MRFLCCLPLRDLVATKPALRAARRAVESLTLVLNASSLSNTAGSVIRLRISLSFLLEFVMMVFYTVAL
jgi:hypothetical protein